MTRRLVLAYLTITTFALAIVVIPLGAIFSDREQDRLLFQIERDAQVVSSEVEEDLEANVPLHIDAQLNDYRSTNGRIVVVNAAGRSVADSDRIGQPPEDFSTRPEIMATLNGDRATGVRASTTAGTDLFYVAIPIVSSGSIHGAVRITYPSSTLDARVRSTWLRLGLMSLIVLGAVAGVGVALARSVTRPIRRVRDAAGELASGAAARVPTDEGPPEIRDLARTFNATGERVERLLESQRRFVSDASHQLRTPLTALRLRLETLAPTLETADVPKLDAAMREVERLALLVQSLLTLARLDAAPHEPARLDVAAVLDDRKEMWTAVADERDIVLTVEHPGEQWVDAVPGAAEQILDNLISNAIGVSPDGATVQLSAHRGDADVELHVVDQGPGMDDEQRAHAFERFWRAPGGVGGGFGLGLAIVDELAKASGGRAHLDRGPEGVGLDAWVALPIATSHPRRDADGPSPDHARIGPPGRVADSFRQAQPAE